MAGIPSARLEGCAVAALTNPNVDHTYVTSAGGLAWGCWGRASGGSALSHGIGSSIVADCLSQPNSQAGIIYGRTGVCHQTANRILHPGGQLTVLGARGYNLSTFLFGVHGKGVWSGLSTCYSSGNATGVSGQASHGDTEDELLTKADLYSRNVAKSYGTTGDDKTRQRHELAALVQATLEHPLESSIFEDFVTIQSRLQDAQADLVHKLDKKEISPERYLSEVNAAMRTAMDQSRDLLGQETFLAIFGDAQKQISGIIDRDTFLSQG